MAIALHWIPDTLYNYALAAVAGNYSIYQKELRSFHENMLFDIYYQLYKAGHLTQLSVEFSNLDIFKKLLKVKDKRCLLHNCFQALMDHGCPVASELAQAFQNQCSSARSSSLTSKNDIIQLGFQLGSFLLDAGWFPESEVVFLACLSLCYTYKTNYIWRVILQCHTRLLSIRNFYCKFEDGKTSFVEASECIEKIKDLGLKVNFASIYGEFSSFYFSQGNYKESYRWSLKALGELSSCLYPREIIRVLCQAAKACIVKREFKRSEMLIKQALLLAREKFGSRNLVFACTLVDYGYYLLSIDSVGHAIKTYQTALSLHTCVFGGNNLLVAKCHEDLAYTSYAYGYSSGRFKDAIVIYGDQKVTDHLIKLSFACTEHLHDVNVQYRDHADKALSIMLNLLKEDNFLLASVRKVKALILEEIAVDCNDIIIQSKLFAEAQELHTYALQFALQAFGELNMLTAKYYGNLGRLFQSMKKYKEAQDMQLKAIAIKEAILGPDDYEVALSVSHLASLYTYDMELHREAEALFLRSMEIAKKLFGEGYSGLEYDYRGLLRIYTKLGLPEKVLQYRTIFHKWKELRDQVAQAENDFSPLNIDLEPIEPENMMSYFISVQ